MNSFGILIGLYEFEQEESTENSSSSIFSEEESETYAELLAIDSSNEDSESISNGDLPWWFSLVVSASQQLCGLNAINFYLQQIFQTNSDEISVFPWLDSNTYAIIITLVQTIITAAAGYILYQKGLSNKSNMLVSCSIVFLSLSVISGLMYFKVNKFYLMFPTLLYQIGFSFGLGPTTWTIIAESINQKHKDLIKYTGQTVAVNSMASFLIVFSFYPLVQLFSMAGLFSIYAVFTLCYFVFILFIY